MEFIAHRVNSIEELKLIPKEYGIEIDLRDFKSELVLQHEPYTNGESFEEYLKHYDHGTMILNIKSERIEDRVLVLLKKYQVKNYFFLDSSFPMIHQLTKINEKNIALRFSEFEGMDTLYAMQYKIDWIWVDCFTTLPINEKIFLEMRSLGYKICLVSPELQGRDKDIEQYKKYLNSENIFLDAICTKEYNINRWL